jgi:hypothetical protein
MRSSGNASLVVPLPDDGAEGAAALVAEFAWEAEGFAPEKAGAAAGAAVGAAAAGKLALGELDAVRAVLHAAKTNRHATRDTRPTPSKRRETSRASQSHGVAATVASSFSFPTALKRPIVGAVI